MMLVKNNWINNVKGETICSIVAKNEILCCESEDHSSIILIAVIHWIVIKQVHIQTYEAIFLISSDLIEFFIESRLPPPTLFLSRIFSFIFDLVILIANNIAKNNKIAADNVKNSRP